jgi:hypothetical protein
VISISYRARELEVRDQAIPRQWQMPLERAEYQVALAERRYQEVDPSNRLVANTLECLKRIRCSHPITGE